MPSAASNDPGIWYLHVAEGKINTGANVRIEFPYLSMDEMHTLDPYGSLRLEFTRKHLIFKLNGFQKKFDTLRIVVGKF